MQFFDDQLIVDRLKDPAFEFEIVGDAVDYAAVKSFTSFRPGSVYVVLNTESNAARDQPQPRAKAVSSVTLGVIVTARNYRGDGSEAKKDLKPMVGRVRDALIGWVPPGATPMKWLEGAVMDYDDGRIMWCDVFSTTHVLGA